MYKFQKLNLIFISLLLSSCSMSSAHYSYYNNPSSGIIHTSSRGVISESSHSGASYSESGNFERQSL